MSDVARAEERFWAKVDKDGPLSWLGVCWVWTASKTNGYGRFSVAGRGVRAHRFSYELAHGRPIPTGLQIDHICGNPSCVRPDHLEAVTGRVNVLRGDTVPARNARVTHCPQGHEYTPGNTRINHRGSRVCRTCEAFWARRARREARERREAQREDCSNGTVSRSALAVLMGETQ